MQPNKDKIIEFLRNKLNEKRFEHSVNTAKEAVGLAEKYGADKEKAYIAGMLHDTAKGLPHETLIKIAEDNGLAIDRYETENPELIHGKIGAFIISSELGIKDKDILSAVEWHTTGHANMTILEKIIYLADIIEPGRTFKGVDAVRRLAYEDIDKAMIVSLREVVEYVKSKGLTLHPKSIEAYEFLIKTEERKI